MIVNKNRHPGQVIKFNCSNCDGTGLILSKPTVDIEDEEKLKESSTPCTECSGTGKIEGTIK